MKPHPGRKPSERREHPYASLPRRSVGPVKIIRVGIQLAGILRTYEKETVAELTELGDDLSMDHYIVMNGRPGGRYFATHLEYAHYPPGEPSKNDLLQIRLVVWDELELMVVSIPSKDRAFAELAAARAELVIRDQPPATITSEGIAFFPMQGPQCFTLESLEGAPCYRGQLNTELALALEAEECKEIVETYVKKYGPWLR